MMLIFFLIFSLGSLRLGSAFFGFNSGESSLQASTKSGCIAYKSLASCSFTDSKNPPAHFVQGSQSCRSSIQNDYSQPGFCDCVFSKVVFGCQNLRNNFNQQPKNFNCEKVCNADFKHLSQVDSTTEWIIDTVWHWNNWREVKFQSDGLFDAPTRDCQGHQCFWKAAEGKIFIQWGNEGLHSVQPSADKKSLSGIRFDGERLQARFVRTEGVDASGLEDDLYDALNIDVDATASEIKKAYRKLSREIHPDKLDAANDEERKQNEVRFMKVQRAYEVLKDEDSRMIYDTGGLEAIEEVEKNQGQQGRQQGNDIFSMFFGGGMQQGGLQTGQDAHLELKVSLSDVYNGREITHNFKRRVVCRRCSVPVSTMSEKARERCAKCRTKCPGEARMVQKRMGNMIVQQQEEVPSKEKCDIQPAELLVTVERGMQPGQEIKFGKKGEQTPGVIPGDVLVKLVDEGDIRRHVKGEYDKFKRSNNDLKTKKQITLKEALTGFEFQLLHLDMEPRYVTIRSNGEVIRPGQVMRIKGEGMPVHNVPSQKGDLLVEFEVIFPKQLTEEQTNAINSLF